MKVANMATYPARQSSTLLNALSSISRQVDVVNLCLNQFSEIPEELVEFENINAFIPDKDYRDVGKFVMDINDNDDIFLVDDDIFYPKNYTDYCIELREKYKSFNPIIGFHGVIYSDVFDGTADSRNVFSFRTALTYNRVVNQLGTGTVHCKGWQIPSLAYMSDSKFYVDVRFSRNAYENGWPLICGARDRNWMEDMDPGDSIFEKFTQKWPTSVCREVQSIAGYGKLPLDAVQVVEQAA